MNLRLFLIAGVLALAALVLWSARDLVTAAHTHRASIDDVSASF